MSPQSNDPSRFDAKPLLRATRRQFFQDCGIGLGGMALSSMLAGGSNSTARAASNSNARSRDNDPLAPRTPHFQPRAKSVIFLFMAGGPSQLELFDFKPKLQGLTGQPIPQSFIEGKRFAFMDTFSKEVPKLLGTRRKFAQHGESGQWVSECLPWFSKVVDDVSIVRSVATDVFNHAPAKIFLNTGSPQFGRPSMGAWVTYGIGSESSDLPGFVVLQSGPRGPRGGALNWGSGFLPTAYQGVPLRSSGDPILNLANPKGVTPRSQRAVISAVNDLNAHRLDVTGDPEIATRIAAFEMAYRMQTSAPELMDLAGESKETMELYGAEPGVGSFANNCLLARRLVERGVRFVQLYHTDWDHHGVANADLNESFDKICKEIDRPCAALISDLKRRGLLEDTLVVWGGEFGRTPMGELRETLGRNHHIDASTMWLAGGGVRSGLSLGSTDELGFFPTEDRVHVHDLQATILHLLGLEHTRLTYRFQGRDFRLTDVGGKLVTKLLA